MLKFCIPTENHNINKYMDPNIQQHYLQKPGHGSDLNVHQQSNE